jgi:hypothetical protein
MTVEQEMKPGDQNEDPGELTEYMHAINEIKTAAKVLAADMTGIGAATEDNTLKLAADVWLATYKDKKDPLQQVLIGAGYSADHMFGKHLVDPVEPQKSRPSEAQTAAIAVEACNNIIDLLESLPDWHRLDILNRLQDHFCLPPGPSEKVSVVVAQLYNVLLRLPLEERKKAVGYINQAISSLRLS